MSAARCCAIPTLPKAADHADGAAHAKPAARSLLLFASLLNEPNQGYKQDSIQSPRRN